MRLAAVLGFFLVLLSWAFHFRVGRQFTDGRQEVFEVTPFAYQSHLALFTSATLAVLALASPSVWVGLALGWMAWSIPLTAVAWARGWIPAAAGSAQQSTSQMMVAAFASLYVVLSGLLHPALDLPWWALAVVLWGAFNAWIYISQRSGFGQPAWLKHTRIVQGGEDMGVLDNGSELAWLMGSSVLAAAYLGLCWHPVFFVLAAEFMAILLVVKNQSSLVAFATAGSVMVWALRPEIGRLSGVVVFPLAAVLFWRNVRHRENSLVLRLQNWTPAATMAVQSHALGMGLGIWINHQIGKTADGRPEHQWTSLHNDWLQSILEVGIAPPLCALVYLVTQWVWLPATPEAAYAFAVVASVAVFGCLYYPLRVPHQAFMLVVAMAALR